MAHILIVDDDPVVQKLMGEVLKREGHSVHFAKDGIDAMVALKQKRPDILVLDVMMPEMNGYDVCHNIKFDPEYKTIPVLIITSREQELDPRLGMLMGVEYMHKSCMPKDLVDKVRQMLAHK